MKEVIEAMARAMFVNNWADREEQEGRCYPGQDLMDVAPETPEDAILAAYRLAGHFEALNKRSIASLFVHALVVDNKMINCWGTEEFEKAIEDWAEDFGHYLAMRALGTGVAWEDDHKDAGIVYPHFEYYGC